ncbi:hypothetical protein ROA7745_00785 [Roseovarius aestuarii]|uniref:Alpha/beta hydrolase family protein n=1 Tax=Roseovarius aestuarii TaxID=475083 RepID=A0A1X7BMX6_9RHOB|nr:hypothetical protein ROA7745_00785 [Roseovarius aestuarii]
MRLGHALANSILGQALRIVRLRAMALILALPVAACDTLPVLTSTAFPGMHGAPSSAQVYYVTDRSAVRGAGPALNYGHERSASMAFGQTELSFDKLAVDAGARQIRVRGVTEHLRFPATPLPLSQTKGEIVTDRDALANYNAVGRAFQDRVGQLLKEAGQDQVIIFVHGYNNDFDEAMTTMANIWQATDRNAVPIAYTWPADNPGLFGYFKDRESGEFSIFHLKETLRLLAGVPGLKKIQLIAHSRGTDVATTALREMVIAARAADKNPRSVLKIDNLVLAAPDLDIDVARQRLIAERFAPAFERVTVYMNPSDGALAFAQTVNSGTRFGRLSFEDLSAAERESIARVGNVYFIDVSGVVDPRGHSYFRENPVVLSDIVALLKTSASPDDPVRNLSRIDANFWMLEQFPDVIFQPSDR